MDKSIGISYLQKCTEQMRKKIRQPERSNFFGTTKKGGENVRSEEGEEKGEKGPKIGNRPGHDS